MGVESRPDGRGPGTVVTPTDQRWPASWAGIGGVITTNPGCARTGRERGSVRDGGGSQKGLMTFSRRFSVFGPIVSSWLALAEACSGHG
jgi:hypothetical protein